jgi:DNA-binding helix-hairpin-helix protein with protein kinase domain
MTALVVAIALVVGVVFSEVLMRSARKDAWPARRLAVARHELQCFSRADNDEARQAHIIRGGMATLTLSLAVLGAIAVIACIFVAPLYALDWDDRQSTVYFVASTVIAIAWWMLRRARQRA